MSEGKLFSRVLIANRGEIAIRIAQAASDAGIESVAIFSEDEAASLHVVRADRAVPLKGTGALAYLDAEQIVNVAVAEGCDAVHPGYGFLSENATFAARCEAAGITFIGPTAEQLSLFGDKVRAREIAESAGAPVLPASAANVSAEAARAFMAELGGVPVMIKAVAGGGGRGMRAVTDPDELESSMARCAREAEASFGDGSVYLERMVARALHIEVQVLGDGKTVSHLGERDCSIQRRHQKIVEIAPSPQLPPALRTAIHKAALDIAGAANYRNIGTFEFLVDGKDLSDDSPFYFIEANPRIQVEHTVTEEVTGVDLVRTQFEIAAGASLEELGLDTGHAPTPRGFAVQLRVNMERIKKDGTPLPSGGTIESFMLPHGPGIRVDTLGFTGFKSSPHFDSLLAKLIVTTHRDDFGELVTRALRALSEFSVTGINTNRDFLMNLLEVPAFRQADLYTRFIEDNLAALVEARSRPARVPSAQRKPVTTGAKVDAADPLAVLNYGKQETAASTTREEFAEGVVPILSSMQSTIVSINVVSGDEVSAGQELLVLNAMKMEHVITAPVSGSVQDVRVLVGDTIAEDTLLVTIEEKSVEATAVVSDEELDLDTPRADLAELLRRRALTSDESRKKQVEKRHARGGRTAKENVADLCDPDSFMQFGSIAVGAGLSGTVDELLDYAPSDGLVMGLGHVNGAMFDESKSRIAAVAYDYTVLAGTQGGMNHKMMDRMFQVAQKLELPVVLFSEGGGGRAGGGSRAADAPRGTTRAITGGGGLNTPSWMLLGQLSGRVPIIGINSGLCFAGNAALLGCCDVIIATRNSSIGMGGPAMIEGGGLGVYRPEEVGPMSIQVPNGVVDIAVEDEEEAVAAAKKYLSYFQGRIDTFEVPDQRRLRHAIPENRLRVYDIRELLATLADKDSVLELRQGFGKAMLTAFIRLEGRPVGVIANDPTFLSGAIDSDAADKAARFMTICDAFDIPLLFLCDTPGIMVGPEAEKEGTVRHAARMFVTGASVTVPSFMVILRKAYGLGAQAMAGGCHKMPGFVVAWPTSEFGGMGLEGQVKLGQRARLEAIEDPKERQVAFEKMVEAAYNHGKGLNAAHVYEIEDVIDPADTRKWVVAGLRASPPPLPRRQKKRPCIDAW
ncbi:MAG: carbamoyl-phosphate synthase large subunit [Pseudomonadales bacterium]|nr:carbamoyl-phosphate synthase large subunit [Pseudomonadales bacterium]